MAAGQPASEPAAGSCPRAGDWSQARAAPGPRRRACGGARTLTLAGAGRGRPGRPVAAMATGAAGGPCG